MIPDVQIFKPNWKVHFEWCYPQTISPQRYHQVEAHRLRSIVSRIYSPPKGFPFAEAGQNSIFLCNNSNAHGSEPSMSVPDTKQSSSTFLIIVCCRQRWFVRNHPFSELAQNKLCWQISSFPKWSLTWKLLSPSLMPHPPSSSQPGSGPCIHICAAWHART